VSNRPDCRACKGRGVTDFGDVCRCNPRDCWHGQLARSCELCERDGEIEDRDKTIKHMQAEIQRLTFLHDLDHKLADQWKNKADELATTLGSIHVILTLAEGEDLAEQPEDATRAAVLKRQKEYVALLAWKRKAESWLEYELESFAAGPPLPDGQESEAETVIRWLLSGAPGEQPIAAYEAEHAPTNLTAL
jgi:hypothetical protein